MVRQPPDKHIPADLQITNEVLVTAANRFGTPLYIYDEMMLRRCWERLTAVLPQRTVVHYSVKANPNIAIINVFGRIGAHFEIASMGELLATSRAGIAPSRVIFVGPGKSRLELEHAARHNLKAIVAESAREVADLESLAAALKVRLRVALRVNPGQGHGTFVMGGPTQFGMEPEVALRILCTADTYSHLDIIGVHGYLGTRVLDWKLLYRHMVIILEHADRLQRESQREFSFVDVGGGFGIPYYEREEALDLESLRSPLVTLFEEYWRKHPGTEIAVESGRFLVAQAGVFVARVVDVKDSWGQRFVIVDGGINVFGGYDLYGGARPLPIRVVGHEADPPEALTLCGPLCTPMDRLAANILLPVPKPGDLIAFYLAGAYGFTASPGLFLSHGFPCEILLYEGELVEIRRRASYDSLFAEQIVPSQSS